MREDSALAPLTANLPAHYQTKLCCLHTSSQWRGISTEKQPSVLFPFQCHKPHIKPIFHIVTVLQVEPIESYRTGVISEFTGLLTNTCEVQSPLLQVQSSKSVGPLKGLLVPSHRNCSTKFLSGCVDSLYALLRCPLYIIVLCPYD